MSGTRTKQLRRALTHLMGGRTPSKSAHRRFRKDYAHLMSPAQRRIARALATFVVALMLAACAGNARTPFGNVSGVLGSGSNGVGSAPDTKSPKVPLIGRTSAPSEEACGE